MGNYNWTAPITWAYGDKVTASDMNAYVSNNAGFIFETIPTGWFGAANAVLPSSNAATAGQFETASGTDYSPNFKELVFSGTADNAAQWTFRSWFTASDVTGVKIRAYTTDATAASDDVDIDIGFVFFDTDGQFTAYTYTAWTTQTINAATLEDTAYTFETYTFPASDATAWDSITYGGLGSLQVKRLGSADELPLDLHIERVWIY